MAEAASVRPIRARVGLWLTLGAPFAALGRQANIEWAGSPLHRLSLGGPRASAFSGAPREMRPADPEAGKAILSGVFALAGQRLEVGPQGDPFNQPSPSRAFAIALHQMDWLRDLLATGEPGAEAGLRHVLAWRRAFGGWNRFSWEGPILAARVGALASAGRRLAVVASDAETAQMAISLARQARRLRQLAGDPAFAAKGLAGAGVAGAVLAGRAGDGLLAASLPPLAVALENTVLADGVHASRSPAAGMDLLFDLLALDDALSQRGRPAPEALPRAIDRLTAALRFFTLADGRLAAFQGGEAATARLVSAARAHDDETARTIPLPREAPHGGYQRMDGASLHVIADAGPPARGLWSGRACGQPLALEVVAGRNRLITNTGWSPAAGGHPAARLAGAGSTVALGRGDAGAPLAGMPAFGFGPRLVGGARRVQVFRRENEVGVWVDMAHDGWLVATGLTHERRLFLDRRADELRGEDRFVPGDEALPEPIDVTIRFHLMPDVRASLARDQRSVLLKTGPRSGWWLRNDAGEVSVEPTVVFDNGLPQRSDQVVMRGRIRADRGGHVRWKLSAAESSAG
jgi:uncharacterized heparinase superfamily protein